MRGGRARAFGVGLVHEFTLTDEIRALADKGKTPDYGCWRAAAKVLEPDAVEEIMKLLKEKNVDAALIPNEAGRASAGASPPRWPSHP